MIKARTIRRLPEDQRWRADEVLNIRGVPSNPVQSAGGDQIEANGVRRREPGKDEHMPVQEGRACDTRATVAAPDSTVRRMYFKRTSEHTVPRRGAQDVWGLTRAERCHTTTSAGRGSGREWSRAKMVVRDGIENNTGQMSTRTKLSRGVSKKIQHFDGRGGAQAKAHRD